jgi:hypothetical protein
MKFLQNPSDKDVDRLQKEISIGCRYRALDYLRTKEAKAEKIRLSVHPKNRG